MVLPAAGSPTPCTAAPPVVVVGGAAPSAASAGCCPTNTASVWARGLSLGPGASVWAPGSSDSLGLLWFSVWKLSH